MHDATKAAATKACSKCHVVKPLEAFCVVRRLRDGRNIYCRVCTARPRKPKREKPAPSATKSCSVCMQEKPTTAFRVKTNNSDGRGGTCKACAKAAVTAGYSEKLTDPDRPDEKRCPSCKETKPLKAFGKAPDQKWGVACWCKQCTNAKAQARHKAGGLEARKQRRVYDRASKDRFRAIVWRHLSANPCVDCGETDPVVLEFDHVRGKNFTIGSGLKSGAATLYAEFKLCEVRCRNCHIRITHARANTYRHRYAMLDESPPVAELESGTIPPQLADDLGLVGPSLWLLSSHDMGF